VCNFLDFPPLMLFWTLVGLASQTKL